MSDIIKCLSPYEFCNLDRQTVIPRKNDILYFSDWFDSKLVEKITTEFGAPSMIICDVESTVVPMSVPIKFIPALDMGVFNLGLRHNYKSVDISQQPKYCFNFTIATKRPSRYLLLKLIEWFGLESCIYSWSGEATFFDCTHIIQEFSSINESWATLELKEAVLTPVKKIDVKWKLEKQHGIYKHVFSDLCQNSVTALITESATDYQPNYTFTEKTLFPLLYLNFPIWVGSYGQAQQAKHMGIDIFEDVVDHRYQYKKTLVERCYYAIHDNLTLLTDFEHATRTRSRYLARLEKNQQYFLNGAFENWIENEIQTLPESVKCQIQNQSFVYR